MRKKLKHIIRAILLEHFIYDIPKRMKLKMYIPNNIWKIKEILNNNGYDLYIIGGAVRDALYKKTPKDYDLVTNATYDIIQELFKDQPFVKKLLKIGEKFSINFLITTDGDYELATYRSDVGGGRKSTIKIEDSLKKDIERRDLTINALAYDLDKQEVIDYVGGIEDIKNKVLSAVGNPEDRFIDDPLRKLRAVRFAARIGSNISPKTAEALLKSNSMADINGGVVSMERRKEEYFKGILTASSVVNYLKLLQKFNLFEKIFEGSLKITIDSADFLETHNPIVVTANILQQNFNIYNISQFENFLNALKYSNKKGSMEIPRIIFLMMLKTIWLSKEFNADIFYVLKKRFFVIGKEAIDDMGILFSKLNIDLNFKNALLMFFKNKISNAEKEELLKINNIKYGPEFGQKLKQLDYQKFIEYYGNK